MKISNLLFASFLFLCISTATYPQSKKNKINTVIDRYFDAIGGEQRAKQIKTFSSEAIGSLKDKELVLKQKMMLPNLFYTAMYIGEQSVSINIFDGENGVVLQLGDEIEFTKDELKRHKKNRSIFPEFDYRDNAKYIGIEKVEQQDCHVLQIDNSKVYYSVESGLKRKGISIQEKDGKTFLQELFFGNYVEIEGLLFPTNLLMIAGNNKIEFQTRSILINRDVSKNDFLLKN